MNPLAISKTQIIEDSDYIACVKDIIESEPFLQMRRFTHHGDTSCLKHCVHVSYCSYLMAKRCGLDYKSVARASLLHDLFLYDWHTHAKMTHDHFHGFTHPKTALKNALLHYELNELEQNIILRHMWPLTPIPPKFTEGFIIVLMDKYCGLLGTIHRPNSMGHWLKAVLKV